MKNAVRPRGVLAKRPKNQDNPKIFFDKIVSFNELGINQRTPYVGAEELKPQCYRTLKGKIRLKRGLRGVLQKVDPVVFVELVW